MEMNLEHIAQAALDCYRRALTAMGKSTAEACPHLGGGLRESLARLNERLQGAVTPEELKESGETVEGQIEEWGHGTAEYLKEKAGEVKEILMIMARTSESIGERDQRYAAQIQEFTGRLQKIGDLDDLTKIRRSLAESALELKNCVDKMARESQQAVASLKESLSSYEVKLKKAEETAAVDGLTGLTNRMQMERELELRISGRRQFWAIMIDLNNFKPVNDTHGHAAGDALLKQFAGELRAQFGPLEAVGRWGGDEFLALADGGAAEANSRIELVRKWALGQYTVPATSGPVKVTVDAAVGMAVWSKGMTAAELIEHADAAMYRDKAAKKRSSR